MVTRQTVVPVTQPFDFNLSLAFLRGFSPMMGEQRLTKDTLVKSWIVGKQPITVTMKEGKGGIDCSLTSPRVVDDERLATIRSRVASFLSAGDDLDGFYALAARDRDFAPVARRLRGLHHPRFGTPFESACWGVINQRIQLAQARKLKAAIVHGWGARGCDAFPEAKTLARVPETELAEVLGHERKARAVASVSRAFAKVDDEWLAKAPIEEVEAWLRTMYGVGDFTTGFVLYRGLGRPITASHASFTLRSPKLVAAAQRTYGPKCNATTLRSKALSYGPWLGLWSLYLWAATFVPQGADVPSAWSANRKLVSGAPL